MPRKVFSFAAGSVAALLLAGCSLSSPDQLPGPGPVTADTSFTLLQTTDIHDHASGEGPLSAAGPGAIGSYARIATYVNAVRASATAEKIPVVLVDSGDWTMGTLYDLTLGSQPLGTFNLDTLRYDCTTLGNHEFDYTPKGLATMLGASQAKFGFHTPIVASNMMLNGNTDLAPYVGTAILPYYTETLANGLKVGFIGLMGKDAATDAPNSYPVAFTDYSTDYAPIQAMVDNLRNTLGCHVVIALSHAGTDISTGGYTGEDINLAKHVTGIDVIASGHTHNAFADASANHPVANGAWTTQVICAGAYSTNVSRLDLTYHVTGRNTTVTASSNKIMNDTTLAALPGTPGLDPAELVFVGQADAALNFSLGSLFTQFFPDYAATDTSKGLYHPIGFTANELRSNDQNPVLSPNGLGNLCADGVRNVPNAILFKSLMAAGWNGDPTSPSLQTAAGALMGLGYDPTPYVAGVVPTGVIRDYFAANGVISFANAYDVLPLGITPDTTQSLPVGYPMMSVYLSYADIQKLCALQLLAQCNLTPSNDYLNMSGLSYALDTQGSYTYFKYATAAAVLQVTETMMNGGSTKALTAMGALAEGASDPTKSFADMAAAAGQGNEYALAILDLNDAGAVSQAQMGLNLQTVGQVAALAQADAANHTTHLNAAILTQAIGAIGPVSAFASTDAACTGAVAALNSGGRYRVAGDLYAILMLGAVESQFGVSITPYAGPTGTTTVSAANLAAAMANRINLNGPSAAVQELKEWMTLVLYLITPPAQGGHFTNGVITNEYLSTPDFTTFYTHGTGVQARNASYPLASIGQLMTTLQTLEAAH